MNVIAPLIANLEAPMLIEPGLRALHDPAIPPQTLRGVDLPTSDARNDVASAQGIPTAIKVIGFIGVQFRWAFARAAAGTADGSDGVDGGLDQLRVVDVGARLGDREGNALAVDHNMALRARFAAIRRVRACLGPPFGAGTEAESSEARDQSIWSACPKRFRRTW